MKITDKMILFWDSIYSNFHPCKFVAEGHEFVTSEQYFMWRKATYFGDNEIAEAILNESKPLYCKQMGRKVKGYNEIEWSKVRYNVMLNACMYKFIQNKEILDELLATGDRIIVEASPYDKIWGIGLYEDDPLALNQKTWRGQNLLGNVLMEVRQRINDGNMEFID